MPVRRVKSEYQEEDPTGTITNIEYKDTGETSGSVDVKFDFYIPNKSSNDFGMWKSVLALLSFSLLDKNRWCTAEGEGEAEAETDNGIC